MQFLRQSTASQVVTLGTFVSSTDGVTPNTGLTIANTDILLNKHAATSKTAKNSGGATHISVGDYYTTLDATDTGTLGRLTAFCAMAACLQVKEYFHVLAANVYDSIVLGAGTDLLDISMTQIAGIAAGATNLAQSAQAIVSGTAITGTLTNSSCTSSLTLATDTALVGRQIIFLGDVTAALKQQAGIISAYTGSTKLIAFSTLTTAPANLDSFVIV